LAVPLSIQTSLSQTWQGQSITDIFAQHDEQYFREFETQALERALEVGNVVVATGAGIIEQAANEPLLAQAHVIWLMARPATSAKRLQVYDDRPLLRANPLANLEGQARSALGPICRVGALDRP
jgi:shikimate kinase